MKYTQELKNDFELKKANIDKKQAILNQQRLASLEVFLKIVGASKVGDEIFDGTGIITEIDKGVFAYNIIIRPKNNALDIGDGIGMGLNIYF